MIESVVFIGAAIIAITQAIKLLVPNVNGAVTIGVAMVVGALVGVLDTHIGVVDMSVGADIMVALAAVGVHTTVTNR